MPTYEYLCDSCHREFEVVKRMSDPPQAACPNCQSSETHRLISHSTFVLKGSGWYVTDYARKGNGTSSGGSDGPTGAASGHSTSHAAGDTSAPESTTPTTAPAAAAPSQSNDNASAKNSD